MHTATRMATSSERMKHSRHIEHIHIFLNHYYLITPYSLATYHIAYFSRHIALTCAPYSNNDKKAYGFRRYENIGYWNRSLLQSFFNQDFPGGYRTFVSPFTRHTRVAKGKDGMVTIGYGINSTGLLPFPVSAIACIFA